MLQPGRKYSATGGYRYGFNGKENDNDVKGEGNQQDYGMRIYDPRLGRFLSVDPLMPKYPELTPFQFSSNRPIDGIDLDGLEFVSFSKGYIHINVAYDPKLKKVTSGSVQFDLTNSNRPKTLDAFLKSKVTCPASECIDDGSTFATFKLNVVPPEEATLEDIDDPNAVGGGGISLPKIPQNKAQQREQRKTREFYTTVGTNSGRLNAIGAAIELATYVGKKIQVNYWDNYMDESKRQTQTYAPLIVNILQAGIDQKIIPESYLDNSTLGELSDYLLKGRVPSQITSNGEIKPDNSKLEVAKSLWKIYENAMKEIEKEKITQSIQKIKIAATDNTGTKYNGGSY